MTCKETRRKNASGEPGSAVARASLVLLVLCSAVSALQAQVVENGECFVNALGRIECTSCRPGWSGVRCHECVDPRVCGRQPETQHDGTVTRYFNGASPRFGDLEKRAPLVVLQTDAPLEEQTPRLRLATVKQWGARRAVLKALDAATWKPLDRSRARWLAGFRSPEAEEIMVQLEGLELAPEAELWVHTPSVLHGPVSARDLSGSFHSTPPLPGDSAWIEIVEPGRGGSSTFDRLVLVHASSSSGAWEECDLDVACFPEAEAQANGALAIFLNNSMVSFQCSGSLLNSTSGTPWVLTAEHCLWDDHDAYFDYLEAPETAGTEGMMNLGTALFVFQYRNRTCGGSDVNSDYYSVLSYSGAALESHEHETDFGLLTLDQAPNAACVSYLGFDATGDAGLSSGYTAGISHPDGLPAQIHVDWDSPTLSSYQDSDPDILDSFQEEDTFLRQVLSGDDLGWPRPGSSGSPMFDFTGRVVGQLSGHWPTTNASCSSGVGWMYGRLSKSVALSQSLEGLLGASSLDGTASTATSATPMFEAELGPCVGQSHTYTINPLVAPDVDIDWQLSGPGAADAQILDVAADGRSAEIVFFGVGNPVPHVNVEITVDNGCFEEQRVVQVNPTFCM